MGDNQAEYYRGVEVGTAALAAARRAGSDAAVAAAALHAAAAPLLADAPAPTRACAAGCTACCHFPVGLRLGEALRLATAVAAVPGLAATVLAAAATMAATAWERLVGRPCPLLGDGRCAVSDARPLPCRALASADATACRDALAGVREVAVPRVEAAWWRGLGLAAALDAEAADGPRELRSALAAVLAAPPAGRAAAFAGSKAVP
ncbi:MAG: hypothetical protein ACK5BN_03245 [Planctomycetota bacterium]